MVGVALGGAAGDGRGPNPKSLRARTNRGAHLEPGVVGRGGAGELIQDEGLALTRAPAHGEDPDGALDGAERLERLVAELEPLRALIVGEQVQGARGEGRAASHRAESRWWRARGCAGGRGGVVATAISKSAKGRYDTVQ